MANTTKGLEDSDEKGNVKVSNRASSTKVNILYQIADILKSADSAQTELGEGSRQYYTKQLVL